MVDSNASGKDNQAAKEDFNKSARASRPTAAPRPSSRATARHVHVERAIAGGSCVVLEAGGLGEAREGRSKEPISIACTPHSTSCCYRG